MDKKRVRRFWSDTEKQMICNQTRPWLDNGFLELDNYSAERAMKPVAIGRKNWIFAGFERGGKAMTIAFTLIETAKLNVSIHKPGSQMSSAVLQITRLTALTNYCPGIIVAVNDWDAY